MLACLLRGRSFYQAQAEFEFVVFLPHPLNVEVADVCNHIWPLIPLFMKKKKKAPPEVFLCFLVTAVRESLGIDVASVDACLPRETVVLVTTSAKRCLKH